MATLEHLRDTKFALILSSLSPGQQLEFVLNSVRAPVTRVATRWRLKRLTLEAVRRVVADPAQLATAEMDVLSPVLGTWEDIQEMTLHALADDELNDLDAILEAARAILRNWLEEAPEDVLYTAEKAFAEAYAQRGVVLTVLDLLVSGTVAYRDNHHRLAISNTEVQIQRFGNEPRTLNFPGILNAILTKERLVPAIRDLLRDMDFAAVDFLIASVTSMDNAPRNVGEPEMRRMAARFSQGLDQPSPPLVAIQLSNVAPADPQDRLVVQGALDIYCHQHGINLPVVIVALRNINRRMRRMFDRHVEV